MRGVLVHSYGRHSLGLQFGASLTLTPPLNLPALGTRQSVYCVVTTLHRPVFLINSRLGQFSATIPGFSRKDLDLEWFPLSRSYGVNLQSSFTSVLSSALEYSSRLPVSVLVRFPAQFSWSSRCGYRDLKRPEAIQSAYTTLKRRPVSRGERRNINLLPIDYASRPRLRHRLTLGGFAFPRKP